MNLKVSGDVSITAFHARQTFGGLFSKMDGTAMFKLYFHTAFLPTNASCVKFKLRELDGVANGERFGPEFKAVVNYRFEKEPVPPRPVRSDGWDLNLIFISKSDYELNRLMMFGEGGSPPPMRKSPSPPPQAPPRGHRAPPAPPKPEKSRTPSPKEDLLIGSSFEAPTTAAKTAPPPPLPPKMAAETATTLTRPASDTLLLDLGFNGSSNRPPSVNPSVACTNPSVEILLNLSGSGNVQPSHHPEDPFFKPASQVKTVSSSADLFGSVSNNRTSPDLFGGGLAQPQTPDLFGTGNARGYGGAMPDLFSGTQNSNQMPDLFGPTMTSSQMPDLFGTTNRSSPIPDLFGNRGPTAASKQTPDLFSDNLLNLGGGRAPNPSKAPQKPVLSPTSAFQPKPASSIGDDLLSNLLGDLDMKSQPKTSSAAGPKKPNYNSSFFQTTAQPMKPKGKLAEDTFNDLLGGFSASNGGSNANKTIGEMKKKEEIKFMDPNEARVFQWKEGKSRNLRALLCSLDTIIWQDSRWTTCGMHQVCLIFNCVSKFLFNLERNI